MVAAVLIASVVGTIARRRVGGASGDVYGATTELSQLGVLVVFSGHL